jgi:DNA-binding NarL/FixJ family response regulator
LPDAIIIDPEMQGIGGIEATRTIHAEFPQIKVIGLSISDEIDIQEGMLQAGAIRYLSKNKPWSETVVLIGQILTPRSLVRFHPSPATSVAANTLIATALAIPTHS